MNIKQILTGLGVSTFLLAILLTGCFAQKYARKKVEAEELKIRLAKAEEQVKQLDAVVIELKEVGANTDTIVLHTTEIKEVVKESKTTLDTIVLKIESLQRDILEIKNLLR